MMCSEALNLRADTMRYSLESGEKGILTYLGERAEQRKEANEIAMRRYILEHELGTDGTRQAIESSFAEELLQLEAQDV